MLESSSMGEMTWKPPWSPGASVQQGQGAADKEEWDPGGTTVDQLTALYQAAFPAIGLILLPPWRREKQGGCKDRSFFGHPDDFMVLPVPAPFRETHERGMNLSPSKLTAPSPARMDVEPRHGPLYNQQSEQA